MCLVPYHLKLELLRGGRGCRGKRVGCRGAQRCRRRDARAAPA
eukprot:gene19063-biopygen10002